MWNRIELKTRGKQAFRANYWACVGVAFIMSILTYLNAGNAGGRTGTDISETHSSVSYSGGYGHSMVGTMLAAIVAASAIFISLLGVFVGNVLAVGGSKFFVLNQTSKQKAGVVLDGFRSGHYGNLVLTMFLRDLYTILWTCLFIIPGIVKSYEYRMIPYILSENPGMDRKEAFAISKRMMTGQKMDCFILDLSFVGWHLLTAVTCGIVGIFYVSPYVMATDAEIYSFNRAKAYNEGYIR